MSALCGSKASVGVEVDSTGLKLAPVYSKASLRPLTSSGGGIEGIDSSGKVSTQVAALRVVLRVRPLIAREGADKKNIVVQITPAQSLKLLEDPTGTSKSTSQEREFAFDRIVSSLPSGGSNSQEEAYAACGAPILDRVLQGYNGTIFAYGQTGSGKTYTMEGAEGTATDALAGELYRGLSAPGAAADASKAGGKGAGSSDTPPAHTFSIGCQYVEIYNERIVDLLLPPSTAGPSSGGDEDEGGPKIRQTPAGGIILENAVLRPCATPGDIVKVLAEGQGRRTKGETNMNALSSRSHAVLTLHVSMTRTETAALTTALPTTADTVSLTRTCKLSLIDLAGSERADATGATGSRLKEGAQINLSLTCLGRVINALTTMPEGSVSTAVAQAAAAASGGSSAPLRGVHVPYRDSKLTRLLQDSLGGTAYTCMVACISPASVNYDETLATLRFAQGAKKVTNTARLNVDPTQAKLAALTAEVNTLRARVAAYEGALLRRAVPAPVSSSLPALEEEETAGALVGGGELAAAVLAAHSTGGLKKAKKGACAVM